MIDKNTGEIKELNKEDIDNIQQLIEASKSKVKKLTEKIAKDKTKLDFEKAYLQTLLKVYKDYDSQGDLFD